MRGLSRATALSKAMPLATVLALAGCAHPSPIESLARNITGEVASVRELPARRKLKLDVLDDRRFAEAFHRRWHVDAAEMQKQRDTWVAFGLVAPDVDVTKLVGDVLDEQVLGFYDFHARRLFVRASAAPKPDDRASGMVLAHEIAHALEDQHFGVPGENDKSDDEKLAVHAIYEGDATVAMLAWALTPSKLSLGEALGRADRVLDNMDEKQMLQALGQSPHLKEAPPVLRALLTFPYFEGMKFLTAFYRTGGFALVDRVFAHPPVSTAQVLHPDKYVAGERPLPVRAPVAPVGTRRIDGGTLGELGTQLVLAGAIGSAQARAHAADWRGDAYTVVERSDGRLALLWATAWDSDEAAALFASDLFAVEAEWRQPRDDGARSAAPEVDIAWRGREVTLVRGLEASSAQALLGSAGAPVASTPPLGALTLKAPPADHPPGVVAGNLWSDEQLGLTAELPPGFATMPGAGPFGLLIRRTEPTRAVAAMQVVLGAVSAADEDRLLTQVADQFAAGADGVQPHEEDRGQGRVAFGDGHERSWSFPGHPLRLRISVLPACDGKVTLFFTQAWDDPSGESDIDRFVASVKPTAGFCKR